MNEPPSNGDPTAKPEEHFAHVRGIRLHYVDWGDNGPPLLMLHGHMRTCRSWDAVARDLRDSFHIICLDARGHGESDWPPTGYTMRDKVDDLAAFCEQVGLRGAIGVGHSSGAAATALFADEVPGAFSRLVLLEPPVVMTEAFRRRIDSRTQRPRRTWSNRKELHDFLRRHRTAGRWREDVIRDVVEHEAWERPDGSIDMKWSPATVNLEERQQDKYDLRPMFRSFRVPLLFIAGGERHPFLYEMLKPVIAETPDFHFVSVKGTGHNMYMERPDAVSSAIRVFLEGDDAPDAV